MNAIDRAADALGSQRKLAEALGVGYMAVQQWKLRGSVPIERCYPIEVATKGVVTRRDLRPDDWPQIWPELAAESPAARRSHRR